MTTYMVTWRYRGQVCVLDLDRELDARIIAVALAELPGREEVRMTTVEGLMPDEEVMERIRQRVMERVRLAEALHA